MPDSGPTVASRTAMVVGGLLIKAARRLRATVEERNGGRPFADVVPPDAATHGPTRIDQQFEPYPHVHFDDDDLPRRRLPGVRLGGLRRDGRRRPRQRRGHGPGRRRRRRRRPGDPPGPRRGPGRGRHAPGDRLRDDRGDQAARRPLPQRPARDVHHPDRRSTRRGSRTILVEAPFSGAPHGAKGVGELPMDVGAPAVVAAIHDATGAWIHELPASPERILAALGLTPAGPAAPPVAGGRPAPRSTSRSRPAPIRARMADRSPAAARPATTPGSLREHLAVHRQRRRRSRSRRPGCAASSTSSARTSP